MEAIVAGPVRRQRITAEIMERTGINEAMIERLVHGFYAKVRADAVLGPIFEARIRNWEPHLAQMCAFWSSVALMTGRYHGTPMAKHLPLPVDAGHFDRWLELFEQTAREICRPRRKRISWNGRAGSRQASNSALPAPTASCSATAKDFGAIKREQRDG
jgi:hemoglobin